MKTLFTLSTDFHYRALEGVCELFPGYLTYREGNLHMPLAKRIYRWMEHEGIDPMPRPKEKEPQPNAPAAQAEGGGLVFDTATGMFCIGTLINGLSTIVGAMAFCGGAAETDDKDQMEAERVRKALLSVRGCCDTMGLDTLYPFMSLVSAMSPHWEGGLDDLLKNTQEMVNRRISALEKCAAKAGEAASGRWTEEEKKKSRINGNPGVTLASILALKEKYSAEAKNIDIAIAVYAVLVWKKFRTMTTYVEFQTFMREYFDLDFNVDTLAKFFHRLEIVYLSKKKNEKNNGAKSLPDLGYTDWTRWKTPQCALRKRLADELFSVLPAPTTSRR